MYKNPSSFLTVGVLLVGSIFFNGEIAYAAPTAVSAVIQNSTATTVDVVVTGTDFDTFVNANNVVAGGADLLNITYRTIHPTSAVINNATTMILTFPISIGTDKTENLVIDSDTVKDISSNRNTIITITDGSITDEAKPRVISAKITGPHEVTLVFSEAVTSTLLDYISEYFSGSSSDTTGISGSGTNTIVLSFPTPTAVTSATGTITIGSTVKDISPALNTFSAVTGQVITDGQAPVLLSFTSTTSDGTYGPGSTINITATYSENITSGSITVDLNNHPSTLITLSATGTNTISGIYVVGATGSGQDTSGLDVLTITAHTVTDLVLNSNSVTTLPATTITSAKTIVIDTTAPIDQNEIFTSSISKLSGAQVPVATSLDQVNRWFAPIGTTYFIESATTTKAACDGCTSINASTLEGEYRLFVIDIAGNISNPSTAILTVVHDNIFITSTGSGTNGTYIVGDTVTASWNNTVDGDNIAGIHNVSFDFSEFGGGIVSATAFCSSGPYCHGGINDIWIANYQIIAGSIGYSIDRNVSLNTIDDSDYATTTIDTANLKIDNQIPSAPIATPGTGTYSSTQSIILSSSGSDSIHYTASGTATCVSPLYSEAIVVSSSQTLSAVGCDISGNSSVISNFVYTITVSNGVVSSGGSYFLYQTPTSNLNTLTAVLPVAEKTSTVIKGTGCLPTSIITANFENIPKGFQFTKNMRKGVTNNEVLMLQRFLNDLGYIVSKTDNGSFGKETSYFGLKTERSVHNFQSHYKEDILTPQDLSSSTGLFLLFSRTKMNEILSGKIQVPVVSNEEVPPCI